MVDEKKDLIEFKSGNHSFVLPAAVIISLVGTVVSSVNSCQNGTAASMDRMQRGQDSMQQDIKEIKKDQKEFIEKDQKEKQDIQNRITIVEVKAGLK